MAVEETAAAMEEMDLMAAAAETATVFSTAAKAAPVWALRTLVISRRVQLLIIPFSSVENIWFKRSTFLILNFFSNFFIQTTAPTTRTMTARRRQTPLLAVLVVVVVELAGTCNQWPAMECSKVLMVLLFDLSLKWSTT